MIDWYMLIPSWVLVIVLLVRGFWLRDDLAKVTTGRDDYVRMYNDECDRGRNLRKALWEAEKREKELRSQVSADWDVLYNKNVRLTKLVRDLWLQAKEEKLV